ncbi:hypothetical protein GUJ93_ZPchr0007g5805 [Zizania palustris]|uniref:Uncharacterized protein n=1 Tax=Zizania palustris TaxID=103762 RepID=A0A8J5VXQ1_ZIZPA|nr:hypothetical protein GUJ93_ZPchr0007g5805 [Zizania palustris]KAG8077341.1 hypothetical protein GUJ93_ZPchr0007g5805 [Zizania palustris]KAG8077342.1 hypothetical protein GUJ93_ZPchr0007g5805 [Zizania palustris]
MHQNQFTVVAISYLIFLLHIVQSFLSIFHAGPAKATGVSLFFLSLCVCRFPAQTLPAECLLATPLAAPARPSIGASHVRASTPHLAAPNGRASGGGCACTTPDCAGTVGPPSPPRLRKAHRPPRRCVACACAPRHLPSCHFCAEIPAPRPHAGCMTPPDSTSRQAGQSNHADHHIAADVTISPCRAKGFPLLLPETSSAPIKAATLALARDAPYKRRAGR